jgi:hypothetical protein
MTITLTQVWKNPDEYGWRIVSKDASDGFLLTFMDLTCGVPNAARKDGKTFLVTPQMHGEFPNPLPSGDTMIVSVLADVVEVAEGSRCGGWISRGGTWIETKPWDD